eukprot:572282-Alexandrium_andersonii.AAC.1
MAPPPHPDGAAPGGTAGGATLGETPAALHPDDAGPGGVTLPPQGPFPGLGAHLDHRSGGGMGNGADGGTGRDAEGRASSSGHSSHVHAALGAHRAGSGTGASSEVSGAPPDCSACAPSEVDGTPPPERGARRAQRAGRARRDSAPS